MSDWLLDLSGFWQGTGGVIISGLVAYFIARWGHNRGQMAERRRQEHQDQTRAAIKLQDAAETLRTELSAARSSLSLESTAAEGLARAASAAQEFGRIVDREAPWFSYEVLNRTWWFGRPPRGAERILVGEEAQGLQVVARAMFSRFRQGERFNGWSEADLASALDGALSLSDMDLVDDAIETTIQMTTAYMYGVTAWRNYGEWPHPLAWPAWFADGSKRGFGSWVPGENAVTLGWRAQEREKRRGRRRRAVHDFLLRPYFRRLERSLEDERQEHLKENG